MKRLYMLVNNIHNSHFLLVYILDLITMITITTNYYHFTMFPANGGMLALVSMIFIDTIVFAIVATP